jgi:hypothetical protein
VARGTTLFSLVYRLRSVHPPRLRIRLGVRADAQQVTLDVARERLHAGRCYRCGEEVADGLARLGSILCHDCREAGLLPTV